MHNAKLTGLQILVTITILALDRTHCQITDLTSVGTALCANFQAFDRKQWVGATAQAGIDDTNKDECEVRCRNDITCTGYELDEDPITALCWHYNRIIDTNDLYDKNTVTLFVVVNRICFSTSTTAGLSTTTPFATTSLVTGACFGSVDYPGQHSVGATAQPNLDTATLCLNACVANPSCTAYEVDTNPAAPSLCWFYFTQVNVNDLFNDNPDVTLFVINRFPCTIGSSTTAGSTTTPTATTISGVCANYNETMNTNALGATPQPGVSETDCRTLCTNNMQCVAYERNLIGGPDNPVCWLHLSASNLNELFFTQDVTIYIIQNRECNATTITSVTPPGVCANFDNPQVGARAIGATSRLNFNEAECRQACVIDQTCVAYEIDTNPATALCWIHNNINNLNELYSGPTVTLHVVNNRICTTTATGTTSVSTSVATTTAITTGTVNCANYQSFPESNSVGAVAQPGVTTQAACEAVCTNNLACVAYEVDTNPAVAYCWIHTVQANLDVLYFTATATQYAVVSRVCPDSTSGPTATGTTTAVSTGTGGPCATYSELPFTQSVGATAAPTATTRAACEAICTQDTTCVAFEIDTAVVTAYCWIHRNAANLEPRYFGDFVTQYVKTSSECTTGSTTSAAPTTTMVTTGTGGPCATYRVEAQTQGVGATDAPATTMAACEAICTQDTTCVAYEIDTAVNTAYCWIHRNAANLDTPYFNEFVTQYVKISSECTTVGSGTTTTGTVTISSATTVSTATTGTTTMVSTSPSCVITWQPFQDRNVPGGIPNRATTLESCQQACINNLFCIGVDVIQGPDNFFCYIITTNVPMTVFPGNTHYRINRSTACPTPPTTIAPSPTSTTTTPPPGTGCDYLRVTAGYNSDGGNLVGTMAESECVQACLRDPTCLAVDYAVRDRLCFSHTSLSGSKLATCCMRYECANSPCTDTYVRQPNMSPDLNRGEIQNGVTTQANCELACENKNCSRYSFINGARIPTQSCYLYYSFTVAELLPVTPQNGIDLFVRKRCVMRPDIPALTTTPGPPSPPPNYCPVDVVFVVDSSGSIRDNQAPGVDNWRLMRDFIRDVIVGYLTIGPNYDRAGLVVFSESGQIWFDLNDYLDTNSVLDAVERMPFIGYETNTPLGLNLGREIFMDPSRGARNRSAKIMVLVTDGVVTDTWRPNYLPAIEQLKALNIARYGIGVTTEISTSDLLAFTSSQDAYTTVLTFEDLNKVRSGLGTYINAVNCDGQVILTSPMTSTSTTTTTVATTTTTNNNQQPTSTTTSQAGVSSSTTTPTTTTTTPTTTTTTVPTTTRPLFPLGEGCFGTGATSSSNGPSDPTRFPQILANRNSVYVLGTDSFVATSTSGFYYVEICAGMQQSLSARLLTRGAFPPQGFAWDSTGHNGVVSGCRGGILTMTRGVRVYLQQMGGGLYSNQLLQTSWSIFSITDIISRRLGIFSAIYSSPVSAPNRIEFINPVANPPGMYDSSTYEYICGQNGVFFFSYSVGVDAGQTAQVHLLGLDNTFEIIRSTTVHSGVTTLGRTVLARCLSSRVRVEVISGSIVGGPPGASLITFNAFPYELTIGQSPCWGFYRSSSLSMNSIATDPLPFDQMLVQQNVGVSNNQVTIQTGGYYYVYISAAAEPNQRLEISLRVNGQAVFNVLRESTNHNGRDTQGHGMVMLLQSGNVLKVVNEANSALYSSQAGLHTSFIGILIYAEN